MKRTIVLFGLLVLAYQTTSAQKDVYSVYMTLDWGDPVNDPFFVQDKEISRILIQSVLNNSLQPLIRKEGEDQEVMDKKVFIEKLNKIHQDPVWDDGEEELSFDWNMYDPILYEIKIVKEANVKGKSLRKVKEIFLDLEFNLDYVQGIDIDKHVARFNFKDFKKIIRKDSRAAWINPYNNAHRLDYAEALKMNYYKPSELTIYDDQRKHIFYGNSEGKSNWINGEVAALKPFAKLLLNNKQIKESGYDRDFYRWYIIEKIVDLKRSQSIESSKRIELVRAIFESGSNGSISIVKPMDALWKTVAAVSPEEYQNEFSYPVFADNNMEMDGTEKAKPELITPVDSLYKIMIVSEMKIDSTGLKEYRPVYLGLIIAADQNMTGLYRMTGFAPLNELMAILKDFDLGPQTFEKMISSSDYEATTSIRLTNIFGDTFYLNYDSFTDQIWASKIPDYVDLELFRQEIYTGR